MSLIKNLPYFFKRYIKIYKNNLNFYPNDYLMFYLKNLI